MSDLYPLTFEPVFRAYLWGGRRLEALGRRLPAGVIAESWEISGHPASPTLVRAGPWAGRPLTEVVGAWGAALLGRRNAAALARRRFPVLVKLLDAAQKLSVQVHPDDRYAGAHEAGEWGKAEMWYFLHAEPGAEIVHGLRAGVTPEAFRQALAAGAIESCLRRLPVRAGDAIAVPAGVIHALLGGAVVLEIQQTSDLTYRVYDWERRDADGRPRPLHIEKALAVLDFGAAPEPAGPDAPAQVGPGWQRQPLCRHAAFSVERITLEAGARWWGACAGESFEIWAGLAGGGRFLWRGGAQPIAAVDFALLPAALGEYTLHADAASVFLRVWVE